MVKDDRKGINGINILRQTGIVIAWYIQRIQNEAFELFGIIRQNDTPSAGFSVPRTMVRLKDNHWGIVYLGL